MRNARGHARWAALALTLCLTLWLATPSTAYKVASEAISCGGAPAVSGSYKAHDTVAQGPIGPVAEGGGMRIYDGFWLTLPSINVPVEGSFYADPAPDGAVTLRWSLASLWDIEELNVYRAESEEGPFERINEEPLDPESPGSYEDEAVWPDTEFWYELRAVLSDGSEDVVAGSPAMVRTGGTLRLALYPARPNPFGRTTTLRFDLPDHVGSVSLIVYNVNGRVVSRLVDDPVERGRHELTWDGRDAHGEPVAAGVYFARLTLDDRTKSQKLMLLR